MFKQLSIYKLSGIPTANLLAQNSDHGRYYPIGATQEKSVGFVPPRGHEHGFLVESVAGQYILTVAIETKTVPGAVLKEKTAEACKVIEEQTGRKPGKKERRNIQDDLLLELLPTAFPKKVHIPVWIDKDREMLMIGSASQGKQDEVISHMLKYFPGMVVALVQTGTSPQAAMTNWLLAPDPADWPGEFSIERACVLKSTGGDAATVKFANHHLGGDEIRKHVSEGKLPLSLAMSWGGKASFTLDDCMRLKQIQLLDGVMEGGDKDEDRFDADVAISTGIIGPLLDDLIEALGGEFKHTDE